MSSMFVVVLAAVLWLGALFAIALYGERYPAAWARHWRHVYALSLAVHCTSWTFYGTVTQASRHGWPLPPTFVGAIVFYVFAFGFMLRLVELARETNATSLADLLATRLGRDTRLAALATGVMALGLIPYLALQLKAVAMSWAMVVGHGTGGDALPAWQDSAFYVALAMALFTMLFGTRRASAAEHNRGLVLALAFEAVFKLAAMLAIGAFVWFGLREAVAAAPVVPQVPAGVAGGFAPLVLLGALAMFIMPHQFHVAVVECRDRSHVLTARWLFPLYLVLIALPVLAFARAGDTLLGGSGIPSDLYVLALPLSAGHDGLALFGFLGGLSAATGMVVVGTLTLSLMIGNHWLAPGLLRGAWRREGTGDLRGVVLLLRRVGIVVIMLLAWAYSRLVAGNDTLADLGAVSFSALATLAPALGFAVWRPQTPAHAASAGIIAAFAVWCWVLLVPLVLQSAGNAPAWLSAGPWAPDAFFGLTGWTRLGRGVGASLFVGVAATLLATAWRRNLPGRPAHSGLDAASLQHAGRRFLPADRVDTLLRGAPAHGPVPAALEREVERELSAVLGSASARVLLDAARRNSGPELETVAAIVGEASQDLRFNQRVLEAALHNMSQGISVVDAQLRLVAWNRRYAELFGYPGELLQVGRPVEDLTAWNLRRMGLAGGKLAAALARRMAYMRAGTPHLSERVLADAAGTQGATIEIRGNPMPGGGFVATFTDVTAFREAESGLKQANETLEQRVAERTSLLAAAKGEAERANHAKSRFLAAIGHDLLQPLQAAHLFTDALSRQVPVDARATVGQVRGALDSTTDLLTGLLDMSRLDAGGLVPEPRAMPLAEVLDPLASEFAALAAERGLAFRCVPTCAWVQADPQLLRRILQNFLGNAVRYTQHGGVLLGVRRDGDGLRIEVHDTGPGIPDGEHGAIFEEFRRGDQGAGPGLGLGLSIAEKIAQLLGTPITLRSTLGRGTVFAVRVPRAGQGLPAGAPSSATGLAGTRVLVVDNEPRALEALQLTLRGWGCDVVAAADGAVALAAIADAPADLWLLDYHLDGGDTGVALHRRLCEAFGARPTLVLSADPGPEVRGAVHEAGLPLLMKPLKPLALKSVLDRLLAARSIA